MTEAVTWGIMLRITTNVVASLFHGFLVHIDLNPVASVEIHVNVAVSFRHKHI